MGEKQRGPQDELVTAFFDISRAHFHSPVRRKVAIRMQGDPSCPTGIAMLELAMYGTKDAARCFDSYCERTMEKLDYNIGVFNPCLYKHLVKDVSVLRRGDDFRETCDTNSDLGIQGRFEQTFTRETHCNIGSATTTP